MKSRTQVLALGMTITALTTTSGCKIINGNASQPPWKSSQSSGAAVLKANALAYDFGKVGTSTPAIAHITITNSGDVSGQIASVSVGSPFSVSGCSEIIGVNESCTLSVTFSPTAFESYSDTLNLNYPIGASSKSVSLSLSGTGVQSGSTDTSFGTSGIASISTCRNLQDIKVQADDKIVVIGGDPNASKFCVERFNANGIADSDFGTNGSITLSFSATYSGVTSTWSGLGMALAIQPDGKIIVAGQITEPMLNSTYIATARLTSNGELDSSFGQEGKQVFDVDGNTNNHSSLYARNLKLLSDGKILLVGKKEQALLLMRITTDGELDTSFDGDGYSSNDLTNGNDIAAAVDIDSHNNIVVAGELNSWASVIRFDENGSIDSSFGSNGVVTLSNIGGFSWFYSISAQSDGSIIAGGQVSINADPRLLAVKITSNGTVDTNFADSGYFVSDLGANAPIGSGGGFQIGTRATFNANGSMVIVGNYFNNQQDSVIARILTTGTLDSSFNNTGVVNTDLANGADDYLYGVATQSNGNYVAFGYSNNSPILIRYFR